jgi:DNA segregation ATPase FtsK/SpoIIIE, S-DNA-T family
MAGPEHPAGSLTMALHEAFDTDDSAIPAGMRRFFKRRSREVLGLAVVAVVGFCVLAMASFTATDPSLNNATDIAAQNWMGTAGAVVADQLYSLLGLGALSFLFIPLSWALRLLAQDQLEGMKTKMGYWLAATVATSCFFSTLPQPETWPIAAGLGGQTGDILAGGLISLLAIGIKSLLATLAIAFTSAIATVLLNLKAINVSRDVAADALLGSRDRAGHAISRLLHRVAALEMPEVRIPFLSKDSATQKSPRLSLGEDPQDDVIGSIKPLKGITRGKLRVDPELLDLEDEVEGEHGEDDVDAPVVRKVAPSPRGPKLKSANQFELPDLSLLAEPKKTMRGLDLSADQLEENARALEGVLEDFGVKGQIVSVKPGPVVTLYELEPAPGIKSSRVISLADDIARSMSAISARVAVVQGRNAIGIELPNAKRETVYLREMFQTENFTNATGHLQVALGKNIGGEPIYADLARMPHLLIAGTTGSGKSVGINTLILSLLYRLPPERCKLIMIDPKMLELSVYEGIPHLLAPVVTDPKKAVVALKWAVREMEERYKKMSKVGVRNLDGYNTRVAQLIEKGEKLSRTVQTGFDPQSGQPTYEQEEMETSLLPYIVVIIDEMADLMMVAGKDIEGAVQRLAQMARAAGIHVIMATQRPSVDVITGTIKANFPTRISFQVTSKIDSRTILSEMGAEQLLGQGDMLYMAGGGRISRLHGPFVSDGEVEAIVKHLKSQGHPDYVEAVTEEADEDYADGAMGMEAGSSGDSLYDQAVAVVLRDKKVSTSYVQRRLQVGYNKAASLIERMEKEGLISSANATGKREILVPGDSARL